MIEYVEVNGLQDLGLDGIEVSEVTRKGDKVLALILRDRAGHTAKVMGSANYPPAVAVLIPKKDEPANPPAAAGREGIDN